MTLDEASRQFHISIEKLKFCEENGFLECREFLDDVPDYTEDELRKVALIQSLLKAGFETNALKKYLVLRNENKEDRKEKIRLLRKQRFQLLDEIHDKQQSLDEIDYMIERIRKNIYGGTQL